MVKSKLFSALDRERGKVPYLERQKKLQKDARRRKRKLNELEAEENDEEVNGNGVSVVSEVKTAKVAVNGAGKKNKKALKDKGNDQAVDEKESEEAGGVNIDGMDVDEDEDEDEEGGEWEDEDSEDDEHPIDTSRLEDSDSDSEYEEEIMKDAPTNGRAKKFTSASKSRDEEDEEEDEDEEEEDIPLSEIDEDDHEPDADIIPRQKLTIDNHSALLAAYSSIALPLKKLPFSVHQSIVTLEPVEIKDVDDDLTRELAFYTQALDAAKRGRELLSAEGVPFTRPTDYFAEMVKSEEHMGNVKDKMREEAAQKKASADAKRQRELKKFGKAVQVAKLQERAKQKRETLDKIQMLKRKRAGADLGDENEDDPFDIAIEKATKSDKRDRRNGKKDSDRAPNAKRQKKNERFGFGGRKKFAKSGDAISSGDLSGFNTKSMKKNDFGGGGKRGKAPRPGKSKRQGRR